MTAGRGTASTGGALDGGGVAAPGELGLTAWPALADLLASARVVQLPLARPFRGVAAREALLIEGPTGWGEFAPFVEYDDAEAAWWLASAIEAAFAPVPRTVRDEVRVNATVPAVPAADVATVLARFDGCRTVKVKVAEGGQGLADDAARVRAVRAVLGDRGRIRVDANGGWTVAEATAALAELAAYGLEYAEQPCASVAELLELRVRLAGDGVAVPLAGDESIRKAADPLAVAHTGAIDVAVLKLAPLGGVRRLLRIADRLAALGVRVVVSSAIDSSVGLAGGVRAAATLPAEPLDCGLGTASLLTADVVAEPLLARAGRIAVRPVRPLAVQLDRHAVDAQRRRWWLERLARCHAVLAGGR